jgi:hypothetical protein
MSEIKKPFFVDLVFPEKLTFPKESKTPFKMEMLDELHFNELQESIEECTTVVAGATDQFIFDFLKKSGYCPKITRKYIKGLNARLKKKGLELRLFAENTYKINKETGVIEMNMLCAIEPIERDPQITATAWSEVLRKREEEKK